jgi:hypothetical protein
MTMARQADFRKNVSSFLQTALHELHQAAMYAQGVAHTDVQQLIRATEKLRDRLSKEMSEDDVQDRETAKKRTADMKARQEAAQVNRLKSKNK